MLRRALALLLAGACVPLTVGARPAGGARERCAKLKETSLHWDAVFAHVSSLSQAVVLRRRIAHYGFEHVVFEKDWCDDVEVLVAGLDQPAQRRAFFEEGYAVGFKISFEPPYPYRKPRRGYVKAIFGIRPTLNRANELQRALAEKGWREATDIERVSVHDWRVVLYRVPVHVEKSFAAEARRAGLPVLRFGR